MSPEDSPPLRVAITVGIGMFLAIITRLFRKFKYTFRLLPFGIVPPPT